MLVTPAQCAMLLKTQLPNGRSSRRFVVLGGFGIIGTKRAHTAITRPRLQRSLLLTGRRGMPSSRLSEALLAQAWERGSIL
jgi:hypothetical protein